MSDDLFTFFESSKTEEDVPRTVVRLKTSIWFDGSGLNYKKTVTLLKRKSTKGYHALFNGEDAEIEWGCIASDIYNLKDGVYEVVARGTDYNWEYGVCEGVEHVFYEYKEEV